MTNIVTKDTKDTEHAAHKAFLDGYTEDIVDILEKLPIISSLIEDQGADVYGGFLRWFLSFDLEHNHIPTMDDVLEYLSTADIDLRIDKYTKFSFPNIHKLVVNSGGRMEYAGYDYNGVKMSEDHSFEAKQGRYGYFLIWIPNPIDNSKWLRYDLTIQKSANEKSDVFDYSVNTLLVGKH